MKGRDGTDSVHFQQLEQNFCFTGFVSHIRQQTLSQEFDLPPVFVVVRVQSPRFVEQRMTAPYATQVGNQDRLL